MSEAAHLQEIRRQTLVRQVRARELRLVPDLFRKATLAALDNDYAMGDAVAGDWTAVNELVNTEILELDPAREVKE